MISRPKLSQSTKYALMIGITLFVLIGMVLSQWLFAFIILFALAYPIIRSKPPTRSLLTACLLWPLTTLLTDILGHLFLNHYFPRNDFGLAASIVTMPLCFLVGFIFLFRWLRDFCPDKLDRFVVGAIAIPAYVFSIVLWTFFTFPLGRISENF